MRQAALDPRARPTRPTGRPTTPTGRPTTPLGRPVGVDNDGLVDARDSRRVKRRRRRRTTDDSAMRSRCDSQLSGSAQCMVRLTCQSQAVLISSSIFFKKDNNIIKFIDLHRRLTKMEAATCKLPHVSCWDGLVPGPVPPYYYQSVPSPRILLLSLLLLLLSFQMGPIWGVCVGLVAIVVLMAWYQQSCTGGGSNAHISGVGLDAWRYVVC
eukprot:COSAG01_NODE_18092_length_1101_cov_2.161677_2_plen_211_part_00